MANNNEIERRRTFAIIAHPDAGKTSLTEKLLLFGGQIQVAGAVKSNKIKKTATSDWMDIEKQRGISVTTSVMEFDYHDYKVNILDTPGHQDFAEDTYRTLTAVDSVIIVVDGAKGVETQTRKLMEVCRMRNTPVIIFINKMDREAKDPFDLLDELEEELHIHVRPLTWPIESGVRFKGVYNIYEHNLNLYQPSKQVVTEKVEVDIHTEELDNRIGAQLADKLRGELELIDGVYPEFDKEEYLKGELAPVFFGSALNNFGVQELLDCFVEIAPSPRPVKAEEREVFKYIENADPMKQKQLAKGIDQLMDEGVAQLFVNQFNGRKIIGTVGQLQFEVIQYRLENEYSAKCRWEPLSLYKACWIESDDAAELEAFKKRKYQYMAKDREGRDVFLADSGYVLQMAQMDFKHIKFHFTSEF